MRFAAAGALAFTATVIAAQTGSDPATLYQRVRQRVLADITRVPNFTCVQTITRRAYVTPARPKRPPGCDEIIRSHDVGKHVSSLVSLDRLRLDVAIADKHEVYSWVGAARFEEGDLSQLVGGGQTITGQFAALLLSIFNDHPTMSFEGTRRIGERRLLEYSYRTPTNRSEYRVRVGSEEVTTAYQGAVLLDSKTGDVVRVTARSAPLPEETGYCQDGSELDYSRLPTAASDVLIPRKTNSWAIGRDGESFVSESAYSSCREYVGESVLRLDDPESADPRASGKVAVGNAASLPAAIPPGLPFDCSIFTPIDSETTAAGDPLQAVLRSSLIDSSGKVLAPAGARVNARVMTFVQRPAVGDRKASLEIGVQLRSVEVDGNRVPLSAFLTSERLPENAWFRLNPRPNQATFLFYQKRLHLTKLDSRWVTATPAAAGTPTH